MVISCDEIRRKIEQIKEELNTIYSLERSFPEGELLCFKNGNRYKWFVKEQGKNSYLFKEERSQAEKLALKKYYMCRKHELEHTLSACNAYLHKMSIVEGETERLLNHPEYGKLLENNFISMNEELRKWQNEEYEICKKHEESLNIKGTQGRMLRSKSEAIIDMMLYKNRIPFRYESKLVLGGIAIYPDFTIRHPLTGKYYYWEHFGMMDNAEYVNHACKKIKIYCENGIVPSVDLLLSYETQKHPFSIDEAERIVKQYFL